MENTNFRVVKQKDEYRLIQYPQRNGNQYVFQQLFLNGSQQTWKDIENESQRDKIRKFLSCN